MSSIRRSRSKGLDFLLIMIFEIAFMSRTCCSASEKTCEEVNGHVRCFIKVWDFGVDWNSAWQMCNSRNFTLPVVRNRNDQDFLEKFLNQHLRASEVWTAGRNYTYDNWTWLDGREILFSSRRTDFMFRYLSSGQPRYYPTISFRDLFLETPRYRSGYICQYPENLCNFFSDTLNVTNGCIKESNDRRSWHDARNHCLMTGGDLAVLEIDYLENHLRHDKFRRYMYDRDFWFGLLKTSWRWHLNENASEEDEIKYTNWSKDWNPLIGDCISIDAFDGTWTARACSEKLKVVCQSDFASKTSSESNSTQLVTSHERESPSENFATLIAVVIVGICVIVISNVIVALLVRKYINNKNAAATAVTSDSEAADDNRYQDLETTRRQTKPESDSTYTNILQLRPLNEKDCQRGK